MGVIRDGGIINQIYGALNAILPPSHRCIIILLNYKNLIQLIKICLRKLNLKHPKRGSTRKRKHSIKFEVYS
jgi:hypothetical protein